MYKKISLRVLLDRIHSGQFGNIFIQAKEDKSLTRADMWEWKFSELHMHDFYEYQEEKIKPKEINFKDFCDSIEDDIVKSDGVKNSQGAREKELQVGGIKYQVNTQESLEDLLEALEDASKGGWI